MEHVSGYRNGLETRGLSSADGGAEQYPRRIHGMNGRCVERRKAPAKTRVK